ncbi:MAG TPA: hypothetical protein VHP11_13580, partial [Tepidisphaeraceae bacterium]|nr:hypothetical protein [Tepidisphaeraceae bacterium]
LKVAGGREVCLRDLQSWIFYAGASSMIIGNYLATKGRTAEMDHQMVQDLGLMWRRYDGGAVKSACEQPEIGKATQGGSCGISVHCEREVTDAGPEAC